MAKLRAALMDLRLLQSFVTVVEEGSLSAASKRRHLSQPALSQPMQVLEEELILNHI